MPEDKRDDKQAGYQHSRQRGQEFHGRFARLLVHNFFCFFFCHV